jgi:Na+/H+-dicarboxylate symporter
MKLWVKVLIGMALGLIFGVYMGEWVSYVKPIGDIFLNSIKMIIVPLVFCALVSGITSVSDPSSLGRIGAKAVLAYLLTTTFAICIGISISVLFKPGVGTALDLSKIAAENAITPMEFDFVKWIVSIVPDNIFKAMAEGSLLQIVFFAMFFGLTLVSMGHKAKPIVDLIQVFTKLVFNMINIIMQFAPFGAFALTSWVVGTQGIEVMYSLANLMGVMMMGMAIQYVIFGVLIKVFAGLSPWPFYKKSLEYQSLAFATSSSKATLATTMKVCKEKLGISNESTSFVLPLGASMNMDGMAIYLGCTAVFFAQASGIDLQWHDYLIITLTATLGSIGGAGLPGSSMIMLPMVLSSANIPIEGLALIAGIDRIGDMIRTTINITGDATVTLLVDKSEGKLDEERYYEDI